MFIVHGSPSEVAGAVQVVATSAQEAIRVARDFMANGLPHVYVLRSDSSHRFTIAELEGLEGSGKT